MGKHQCLYCLQYFVRPFTLKRHQLLFCSMAQDKSTNKQTEDLTNADTVHDDNKYEIDDDMSEGSSEYDVDTDNDSNDDDEDEEEKKISSEKEDETDDEEGPDLFWDKAVNSVYETLKDEFQKTVAQIGKKYPNKAYDDVEKEAFEKMKPQYNKDLRNYYLQFLQEMHALKKSRVHKNVIETAKRLRDMEDYDYDEALQYAVKKRKYLISKKLDEYQHPQLENEEEM